MECRPPDFVNFIAAVLLSAVGVASALYWATFILPDGRFRDSVQLSNSCLFQKREIRAHIVQFDMCVPGSDKPLCTDNNFHDLLLANYHTVSSPQKTGFRRPSYIPTPSFDLKHPVCSGCSPYSMYFEAALIVFSNTFYLGNEYQTILVAANRFCALFFPFHYSRLFGYKSTFVSFPYQPVISLSVQLALLLIYGYRFFALFLDALTYVEPTEPPTGPVTPCSIFFSPAKLTWSLTDGCGGDDNILTVVSLTFLTVTIFNVANFTKIIKFQRVCLSSSYVISYM